MSTEDKQLVEWIEHAKASDVSDLADYMNAIIDFKSALREEIENWKKHESQAMYPSYYYSGRQDALNNVLQLLDSVTPKK